MGCNQSTERKAPQAAVQPQSPKPSAATGSEMIPVLAPAAEERVATPKATDGPSQETESATISTGNEGNATALEEPVVQTTAVVVTTTTTVEPEQPAAEQPAAEQPAAEQPAAEQPAVEAREDDASPAVAEEPVPEKRNTSTEATAEAPKEPETKEPEAKEPEAKAPMNKSTKSAKPSKSPSNSAAPKVPALALTNKPKRRSATPRSRQVTPRSRQVTPSKENACPVKKAQTRSRTPVKRGLGPACMNTKTTGGNSKTANPSKDKAPRKVCFESVPAPVEPALQRKYKARKTAGRHAANIQEEMFLASVAAFERQLTHRGSLDSHLNTR